MSDKIPVPVTFNPYKHHFHFLLEEIERWKGIDWETVDKELLLIGSNLIDFYHGNLSVQQICTESINFFTDKNITDKKLFFTWLDMLNYRKIQLSDKSEWLIKKGNSQERYIHIHPAKFSKHTVRVRATTLKTVIALKVRSVSIQKKLNINLLAVNTIRVELLGISPIKSLQPGRGIFRIWELFDKNSHKLIKGYRFILDARGIQVYRIN